MKMICPNFVVHLILEVFREISWIFVYCQINNNHKKIYFHKSLLNLFDIRQFFKNFIPTFLTRNNGEHPARKKLVIMNSTWG